MKNIAICLCLALFLSHGISVPAQGEADVTSEHWLYMVKTRSAVPAREAEFNAWYDDIDIPDVLAVPGFMRARRGLQQAVAEFPQLDLQKAEGNYVALYDIETTDIDKTIIDLYVGARKMVALGRITNLLKVTEANYYRALIAGDRPEQQEAADNQYVYVQKALCCADEKDQQRFLDWLASVYIPGVSAVNGVTGVNVYALYRIMEVVSVGPDEIPHLLLVHEMKTASIREAIVGIYDAIKRFEQTGRMSKLFVEGNDSAVYLQMSDVKSE